MSLSGNEIREKYLRFMEHNGHAMLPSAALVPENDPTTLFTGSGMQPLVPYLMGEAHPMGTRLTDSQKCFRAEDIDEVGDNRHTTFFEMLGNWSLGDYFKAEQLPWFYKFLTEEVGLDPEKIYVTVFQGDERNNVPRDTESVEIWQKLFTKKGVSNGVGEMGSETDGGERGMKDGERIFYYDASKNWWSRAGKPEKMPVGEIGGPDSEVFYDFGTEHDTKFGPHCHPNCDCGRFLEIGNSVFMEYLKAEDGSFQRLPKQNVDFGGGLERITAAAVGDPDVFKIDLLQHVVTQIEDLSGTKYADNKHAFRVITDHIRGAVFMIGDGVHPSNSEQGYFVRRLLRRAVRFADQIGIPEGELKNLASSVIDTYKTHYTNLADKQSEIMTAIDGEETQFRKTLNDGLKILHKMMAIDSSGNPKVITGKDLFNLFTTHGFPLELSLEVLNEVYTNNYNIDPNHKYEIKDSKFEENLISEFEKQMDEHRAASRAGAEQKFKGGLADHSDKVIQYHTTHHLLLKALQMVLGDDVHQRGSNITGERLRIDFNYDGKMTDEQKAEVEKIVNEQIAAKLPVIRSTIPKEEAETLGAEHEFGAKYPDVVSVYSLGPVGATVENPQFTEAFSIEFCGGPHVENTGDIKGTFKIQKEESSSAGVRRIKGVLI